MNFMEKAFMDIYFSNFTAAEDFEIELQALMDETTAQLRREAVAKLLFLPADA